MTTTLYWKVFASIGRTVATPDDIGTPAFNAVPSPRIYLQLGLPLNHAYIPLGLFPTATYDQLLKNKLKELGSTSASNKLPFAISLPGIAHSKFNMQARLYSPNIVALTLRLTVDSELTLDTSFDALVRWRSLESLNTIKQICAFTLGIIDSGDHRNPTDRIAFRAFPCYHLVPKPRGDAMPRLLQAEARDIVALLLGINKPATMSDDLIFSVMNTNREINKKSSAEQLLLNKQGLLYLTGRDSTGHIQLDRFAKMANLCEIGWVFQRFLDSYTSNRQVLEDFVDYIFTQIKAWLERPSAIFSTSYGNKLAWDVISEELRLCEKLSLVTQANSSAIENMVQKQTALNAAADGWWQETSFSHAFDNSLSNASHVLMRIKDAGLRDSILHDLTEAERSLHSRSYKAAVVMSGAAAEAMLLALLQQETSLATSALQKMNLHDYLTEVQKLAVLPDKGMIALLDNSLRDWRNMVHPGKAQRTGVSLTEDHAKIAVLAAQSLAKSLK
jgi:hypothetical protein